MPHLYPGDLVVFFKSPGVAGDTRFIHWARIVRIHAWHSEDGELEVNMLTTSVDSIVASHSVAIYRHDDDGRINDVTNGCFHTIRLILPHNGEMPRSTYYSDGDRMNDIMRDGQLKHNRRRGSPSQLPVPVNNPSITVQDPNLQLVMDNVKRAHIEKSNLDNRGHHAQMRHVGCGYARII